MKSKLKKLLFVFLCALVCIACSAPAYAGSTDICGSPSDQVGMPDPQSAGSRYGKSRYMHDRRRSCRRMQRMQLRKEHSHPGDRTHDENIYQKSRIS